MTSDSTHEVICDAENVPKVFVAGAVPRLQQSSSIRSPESESERDTYPFSFQLHWRLDVSTCGTEPPWHLPPSPTLWICQWAWAHTQLGITSKFAIKWRQWSLHSSCITTPC